MKLMAENPHEALPRQSVQVVSVVRVRVLGFRVRANAQWVIHGFK